MPHTCFVNGCRKRSDGPGVKTSFYSIPAVIYHQGEQTKELSRKRRQSWLASINRNKSPTKYSKICSDHFLTGKPATLYNTSHPDWAPSLLMTEGERQKRTEDKCNNYKLKSAMNQNPADTSDTTSDTDRVYLDYNATTFLEPEVLEAIHNALDTAWGNPSSSYKAGRDAKDIITNARKNVAEMIGGQSEDIIFTSGGTEANNMVFHTAMKYFKEAYPLFESGTARSADERGRCRAHVITSNLEHDSVKLPIEHFVNEGVMDVTYVHASKRTGMVNVDGVIAAIRPTTCLISIMMANNETGIIQPISEITKRVKLIKRDVKLEVGRILLHTDAAQTIGKIPVNVQELGVDYLTIVGHKFYGPRIGALYVRGPTKTTPIHPMLFGGGQERNLRPGTENTGMIAGLGKAADLVVKYLPTYQAHMREIRDYLEIRLQDAFPGRIHFNGRFTDSQRIPNTSNVSIQGQGLQGYKILECVKHLEASVGAACHSEHRCQPSHILIAIGTPWEVASNALRLSTGRHTTKQEIDLVITDLKQAVAILEGSSEAS